MKKRIFSYLLLLLLVACSKPKSVQNQEVKPVPVAEQNTLQQAIDYTHCKIMALSLSKNPDKIFGAFITNCPCENLPVLSKERITQNLSQAPLATANLSGELATVAQDTAFTNHVSDIERSTNYLSDSIFMKPKLYLKSYEFAQNRLKTDDSTHFVNLQNLLRSKLPLILNPPVQEPKTTIVNSQPLFDSGWFWALVLAVATGGLLLAWWYRFVKPSLQNHDTLNRKVITLEQEVSALKTQQKAMNTEKKTAPVPIAEVTPKNIELLQTEWAVKSPNSTALEDLYFSTPNEDGSFSPAYANTAFKEGASLFKLTKETEKRGKFEVCNQADAFGRALSKPNFLLPVCDEQNPYFAQANRIVTEQKGLLVLENGFWVMKEKAKIRYE